METNTISQVEKQMSINRFGEEMLRKYATKATIEEMQ